MSGPGVERPEPRATRASGVRIRPSGVTSAPSRVEVWIVLYALAGGVAWWTFHLVSLSALAPAVCGGNLPAWLMTAVNVVSLLGVLSALYVSFVLVRLAPPAAAVNGRNRFLGVIATLFNLASLGLVVLESVPVYVLGACR